MNPNPGLAPPGTGRLADRVAVITGGSRGIGLAIARRFAREGARLALTGRDSARLAAAADELRSHGAQVFARAVDVADSASVRAFADEVLAHYGRADVLVNNAGVVVRGALEDTTEAQWDLVLDTNLKGTYLMARAFVPAMRARRHGRVINVSSIAGRQGTAFYTAYCASKHGIVGFTRALALETQGSGVAAFVVCPGSVETDMLPAEFKPGMPAERMADVALFLAAEAPAEMSGAALDVFAVGAGPSDGEGPR